jgi:hypothetical protein
MKLLETSQPQSGELEFLKYKSIFGYIYKNFNIKLSTNIDEKGWVWIGVLIFSIIWLSLILSLILRFIIL